MRHNRLSSLKLIIAIAAGLILALTLILFLNSGTWPPVIIVTGNSMSPNMEYGDIIFIKKVDPSTIVTYGEGISKGYRSMGDYGDVIVFRPYGMDNQTMVIHRAMNYSNGGERLGYHSEVLLNEGYITRGDNNVLLDQDHDSEVSPDIPIKKEWVIGIATYRIPTISLIS